MRTNRKILTDPLLVDKTTHLSNHITRKTFLPLRFSDYFKRGYGKMMDKLGNKREKIVDIQKAVQVR